MSTTDTWTIALANGTRDTERLFPLVDAYRVFYGQPSDPGAARAFVHDRFVKNDTLFIVARTESGEMLGFAHLLFSLETVSLGTIGILEDIYVVESARGSGIGGALLDAAERHARERGLTRLTLATAHQNRTAQRLYLAHGYVPDQRFRSFNRFLTETEIVSSVR
jgi:GNAT superfamily N-acetyltransferase